MRFHTGRLGNIPSFVKHIYDGIHIFLSPHHAKPIPPAFGRIHLCPTPNRPNYVSLHPYYFSGPASPRSRPEPGLVIQRGHWEQSDAKASRIMSHFACKVTMTRIMSHTVGAGIMSHTISEGTFLPAKARRIRPRPILAITGIN